MRNVIPNTIARKYGIELKGTLSIHRGRRLIKVTWNTRAGESFTFYLNDQWDRERDNGDNLAGHTMPLTQEIRVNRVAKLYRLA